MNDKFAVRLYVPTIDEIYNVYLPINARICNVIILLKKSVFELTSGEYNPDDKVRLYDRETGEIYGTNQLIRETNIRNGSSIVLI